MDLINRCPDIIEVTGSPITRKGMVKGKMASGIADMHFVVKGPKGQVMVNVKGTLREDSKTEYNLESIQARVHVDKEEKIIMLYDNYQPVVEFQPAVESCFGFSPIAYCSFYRATLYDGRSK